MLLSSRLLPHRVGRDNRHVIQVTAVIPDGVDDLGKVVAGGVHCRGVKGEKSDR